MIFQFASDLRLKKRCQIVSTLNDLRKRKFGETFLVFLKNLNVVRNLRKKKRKPPTLEPGIAVITCIFSKLATLLIASNIWCPGSMQWKLLRLQWHRSNPFFSWNGSYAFFLFNKVLAKRCFGIVLSIWKFKHISFNCGRKQLGFLSHRTFRSKKED